MQSNEKKSSNRFECIKIKLYLYCQRGRNGRQRCPHWGLRLTREQMTVREIGLPFFFVLIYQMNSFYNNGTAPAFSLKNNHTTRKTRVWQFLISAGAILLASERG